MRTTLTVTKGLPLLVALMAATIGRPDEVSWWTFDDTLDDAVGSNHGSIHGGTAPDLVPGRDGTGGAIALDGEREYVAITMAHDLPISARGRYTIAAWVKADPGPNQVLYCEASTEGLSPVFRLAFDPTGETGRVHVVLRAGSGTSGVDETLSAIEVLDGSWHHVAWVDDAGRCTVYVDGVADGAVAYTPDDATADLNVVTLGAAWAIDPCCFLRGTIDDVRVFDHAMSADEIGATFIPEICEEAKLFAVEPSTVSTAGGTTVTFRGFGFLPGHSAYIGEQPLLDQRIIREPTTEMIVGTSPPLPEGNYLPSVRCESGEVAATSTFLIHAAPPPLPQIRDVTPRRIPAAGGVEVTVDGVNFTGAVRLAMVDDEGETRLEFELESGSRLRFTAPPHAAGFVDLSVNLPGAQPHVVPDALEYVASPVPEIAVTGETTEFADVVVGDSSILELQVRSVGGAPLALHAVSTIGTDEVTVVSSPAESTLDPDKSVALELRYTPVDLGTDLVTLRIESDAASRPVFELALTGVGTAPPPPAGRFIPGPEQLETALAEGEWRASWRNPLPYETILVLDGAGAPLDEIPGDATEYRGGTGGRDEVEFQLVGAFPGDVFSEATPGRAMRHQCERPAPLNDPGIRGPIDFYLYGGPDPEAIGPADACDASGDGGAGGGLIGGGLIGGGLIDVALLPAVNGKPQKEGTKGYIVPDNARLRDNASDFYRNKLTTGFVLEQPATKLEIGAFYEKIATAFELELRGRLTLVHADDPTGETSFAADFSFPDILITEDPVQCPAGQGGGGGAPIELGEPAELLAYRGKRWNSVLFFRADRDPTDPEAQPCLDEDGVPKALPAGEYRLDIFTVGGDSKLPYYVFADDLHKEELLIPGVPCPPYPRVRVTDLSRLRTLPRISQIIADRVIIFHPQFPDSSINTVVWRALGSWTDENDQPHSINPSSPSFVETPDFEYTWNFRDFSPVISKSSGSSNRLDWLIDFGCYVVEITVREKACGTQITRSFEVPLVPLAACPEVPYDFLYPTPAPGDTWAIAGLNTDPPPGFGSFEGKRRVEFRVLVVPGCQAAPGECPDVCPAANLGSTDCPDDDTIRFRLATRPFGVLDPDQFDPLDAKIVVKDLCQGVGAGAKYFHILIEDLGAIPHIPNADPGNFVPVYFQGKGVATGDHTPIADEWRIIGAPILMANYPECLDVSYWSGHFEPEEATYRFQIKSGPDTEERFNPGPTRPIDLLGVAEIPSYDNDVGAGFTARFGSQHGLWFAGVGDGTTSGVVLSNRVDSAPVRTVGERAPPIDLGSPPRLPLEGAPKGAPTPPAALKYEWCHNEEIVRGEFEETIFESILYSGFIGPLPVEIWAGIGVGLQYATEAQITTYVRPFFSESATESHFYTLSTVGIRIPCEVRADILGGVGSISVGLVPWATFEFDTHAVVEDDDVIVLDPFIQSLFGMKMVVEGCVNLLLAEICAKVDFPIVKPPIELIPTQGCCPRPVLTCENRDGGDYPNCQHPDWRDSLCHGVVLPDFLQPGGGEGGGAGTPKGFKVTSSPSLAKHPDGTKLGVWVGDDGTGHVYVEDMNTPITENLNLPWFLRDPSGTFLSGGPAGTAETAIVAFAQAFPHETVLPDPLPADPLVEMNLRSATQEVLFLQLRNFPQFGWGVEDVRRVSEIAGDPGPRTVDGRPAVAGDLHHGDAWVAWVRYETPDFFLEDGVKTIRVSREEFPECVAPVGQTWCLKTVPNVRPQMEHTAIYVRRVDYDGPLGPRIPISPPGINIEPTVAFSPTGEIAYCAWVHDPVHVDLIESNRGREFLYSVYERSTDTWSTARAAWGPDIDPDDYPGLLQPFLRLADDENGILAFTALDAGVSERDTGLGSGRMVFISRLIDGVFREPELVHGRCEVVQYGEWVTVDYPIEEETVDPPIRLRQPRVVLTWQGRGLFGLDSGSGDVMAAAVLRDSISPPVCLTPDDNVHSNVAAMVSGGEVHHVNLDGGPADWNAIVGAGGGGGTGRPEPSYNYAATPLEPDLSLRDCRLSESFPAPGSFVTAVVTVENLGLAYSATGAGGESACGLRAVFVEEDGTERVAGEVQLPELAPGDRRAIEIALEMPLDPVRLRVQLDPNPVDADPGNNWLQCLFGAPCPMELSCEGVVLGGEGERPGTLLRWTNAATYDEIWIYRDYELIATLPGRSTRFVDAYCDPEPFTYEVRGRIGASKSVRTACEVVCGASEPSFIRADSNADGLVNISDPIFSLEALFTGKRVHLCDAAADSNADRLVNISDPIYTLSHLFAGTAAPPAPYPDCGVEPEPSGLDCLSTAGCDG